MRDSQLIDRLVGDLKPVRPRNVIIDALILALTCAVELALFLGMGFMRPDMPAAMDLPSFWWKLVSMGAIAAIGIAVALVSFSPTRSPRNGLRWLFGAIALCLATGWVIDASHGGLAALATRVDWHNGVRCVYNMAILAVPSLIALSLLMRRGASTDVGASALSVGIAAAACGAFMFVFACPNDDPLYIVIWYSVGFSVVTTASRVILPPLLRW